MYKENSTRNFEKNNDKENLQENSLKNNDKEKKDKIIEEIKGTKTFFI